MRAFLRIMALPAFLLGSLCVVIAAQLSISTQTNGEAVLSMPATVGTFYRIGSTEDFVQWRPMVTLQSGATLQHTDSAAPYFGKRFYRSTELSGTGHLTGDHFQTSAGEVIIHPVNHASFVMSWNGKMIYFDPVGATTLYSGFPKGDLIVVTHAHSDHYSNTTLAAVANTGTRIIAPQAVYNLMTSPLKLATTVMLTGQSVPANNTPPQTAIGINIAGVPAYNSNHPLGTCNAYVLTIGDKRIFVSGDTGDSPEMRALPNIDIAFVCMNVPFTMNVATAASVVRAFRPRIVFPYHYRNSDSTFADLVALKQQVGTDLGIEVRVRTWY